MIVESEEITDTEVKLDTTILVFLCAQPLLMNVC